MGMNHLKIPLHVKEWPRPAWHLNIVEIRDTSPHSTEIYTNESKIRGQVGAGAAIYVD